MANTDILNAFIAAHKAKPTLAEKRAFVAAMLGTIAPIVAAERSKFEVTK